MFVVSVMIYLILLKNLVDHIITHNEVLTPVVKTCKIDNRLNILISSSVFMKFYQHIKFYLL